MKSPLISVIVPVYRVEKFLPRCLDSIINQSYTNLEIILVDDGSDDNCPEICDKYAEQDSRIKVIHQKNGGLSAARNAGISAAQGDYIGFIDSDDYIEADMYYRLLEEVEKYDAKIAIAGFDYVNEKGVKIEGQDKESPLKNEVVDGKTVLKKALGKCGWFYVTTVNRLYRKECWETLRFLEGKLNEDEFVLFDLFVNVNKVVLMEDIVYHYVQNTNSITHSVYSAKRLDAVESLIQRLAAGKEVMDIIWTMKMVNQISGVMLHMYQKMEDTEECRYRYASLQRQFLKTKSELSIEKRIACMIYSGLRKIKGMIKK